MISDATEYIRIDHDFHIKFFLKFYFYHYLNELEVHKNIY